MLFLKDNVVLIFWSQSIFLVGCPYCLLTCQVDIVTWDQPQHSLKPRWGKDSSQDIPKLIHQVEFNDTTKKFTWQRTKVVLFLMYFNALFAIPKLLEFVKVKPKVFRYDIPCLTHLIWFWCFCQTHDILKGAEIWQSCLT